MTFACQRRVPRVTRPDQSCSFLCLFVHISPNRRASIKANVWTHRHRSIWLYESVK
ncbi:hypothetical protein M378DRAFT_163019 [Amanita muscaria Koide BX008]|uniref:Uncharacterized protein n=1 Tax=Amanita muscaria (strain Koide BX008) TaxID=946122 RepID=A0A0C2TCP0_AMAMK|nr:hypothetical protein M378DRAFT_163019 [Amanita muscaria Koide BX008]